MEVYSEDYKCKGLDIRMKENTIILRVEHKRDFCLPHIEIWCKGESTDPRIWTEKQQPYVPYILFERTEETIHCYMDERGFDWIVNELKTQMKKDKEFVEKFVSVYFKIYEKVDAICQQEKTLEYDSFVSFLKDYQSGWSIYEAIYFLADMLPRDSREFRRSKEGLAFTDKTGDQADKVIRKSLKKCFPELGELSLFLLTEEIFSKKIPPKEELEKRKKKYFYANDKLFVDKNVEDIEKIFNIQIERPKSLEIKEFRGEIAYKGKVRGIARKIMSYSRANEISEGEILVTAMTTPEFLPALKKAIAFVTDEGGIASHAAIVAREMKKPCIVRTKVATQAIKSGDFIEVDAEKGIVRVLERAK